MPIADEMSSVLINGISESLKAGLPVVGKILEGILSLAGGAGNIVWERYFKDYVEDKRDKKSYMRQGGEKSFADFNRKYKDEEMHFYSEIDSDLYVSKKMYGKSVVDEAATEKLFSLLETECKKNGIAYAFFDEIRDENGIFKQPLTLAIRSSDKPIFDQILNKIKKYKISQQIKENYGYRTGEEIKRDSLEFAHDKAWNKAWEISGSKILERMYDENLNGKWDLQKENEWVGQINKIKEELKEEVWNNFYIEHPEMEEDLEAAFKEEWENVWTKSYKMAEEQMKEQARQYGFSKDSREWEIQKQEFLEKHKENGKEIFSKEKATWEKEHPIEKDIDVFSEENNKNFNEKTELLRIQNWNKRNDLMKRMENSDLWNKVWKECEFGGKKELSEYAGRTDKEKLKNALEGQWGEKLNEKYVELNDNAILVCDSNDNFIFINPEAKYAQKLNMEDMKSILAERYKIPLEELSSGEIRRNMDIYCQKTNEKMMNWKVLEDNRYKNYEPMTVAFLKDIYQEEHLNPAIQLNQLDALHFDWGKRIALKQAMEMGINNPELLTDRYSQEQVMALTAIKQLENSTGQLPDYVHNYVKRTDMSEIELDCLINKVYQNPNIEQGELNKFVNEMRKEQKNFQHYIEFGTIERDTENREKDINIVITMTDEHILDELSKTNTFLEINAKSINERQNEYEMLPADHQDQEGNVWCHYASENQFDFYINKDGELKAVENLPDFEKTKVVYDTLEKHPKYENNNGEKWYSVEKDKADMEILVNQAGKARIEIDLKEVEKNRAVRMMNGKKEAENAITINNSNKSKGISR